MTNTDTFLVAYILVAAELYVCPVCGGDLVDSKTTRGVRYCDRCNFLFYGGSVGSILGCFKRGIRNNRWTSAP